LREHQPWAAVAVAVVVAAVRLVWGCWWRAPGKALSWRPILVMKQAQVPVKVKVKV
jgi:hypothetical protein